MLLRSVSSSLHFLAFPLHCFRFRFGVFSVSISPISTTSTRASSSFASVEQATYVNNTWLQAAEQAWNACARQTCLIRLSQPIKTSSIKHENKRNVASCLIECLMAFKFYPTRSNSTKQGVQTYLGVHVGPPRRLNLFKRSWVLPKGVLINFTSRLFKLPTVTYSLHFRVWCRGLQV